MSVSRSLPFFHKILDGQNQPMADPGFPRVMHQLQRGVETYYYRLPTKLREGNVFTGVSVCPQG